MVYSGSIMRVDRFLRRFLVVLVSVATVVLVVMIVRHQDRRAQTTEPQPLLPKGVDLSLQQVHFSETQGTRKKWELFAATAAYDRNADVTRLTRVRFVVSSAASLGTLQVTADQGEYHHATKDVQLSGHVRVVGEKGFSLDASQLGYRSARALLETAGAVTLVNGQLKVAGTGLELHTETRQARILHQVDAVIVPEKR